MYGTDHAVPSPRLADLIDGVNDADGDVRVVMETLADYVEGQDAGGRDLARRTALGCPGQHADERHLGADGPEAAPRRGPNACSSATPSP